MTREQNLDYRRRCPYDAMGDYSVFFKQGNNTENSSNRVVSQTDSPVKNIK